MLHADFLALTTDILLHLKDLYVQLKVFLLLLEDLLAQLTVFMMLNTDFLLLSTVGLAPGIVFPLLIRD